MNFSSRPAPPTLEFRRCTRCGATRIGDPDASTVLPCKCGGELHATLITIADILAERTRAADSIDTLASRCEANADDKGNVSATKCAQFMRELAAWVRSGEGK